MYGINIRIPTQFNFEKMNFINEKNAGKLNHEITKLGTGYKAEYYSGAPEQVSTVIGAGCAMQYTAYQMQQLEIAQNNIIMRSNVYQQMNSILTTFSALCTQSINGSNQDFTSFLEGGKGLEEQFVSLLNTVDDQGNYLFSGTALNIRPVDMGKYPPMTVSTDLDVPHFEYYQGNLEGFWPTALGACFEKALRAFQGSRLVFNQPAASLADRQKIERLTLEAIKELNNGPSVELGSRGQQIEDNIEWFTLLNTQAKDIFEEGAGADVIPTLEGSLMGNIQLDITTMSMAQSLKMLHKYSEILLG